MSLATVASLVLVVLGVALWRAVFKTRTLVQQLVDESERELQEYAYHHLIELGILLSKDVMELKLVLGGKERPTKKLATKLAVLNSESHELWPTRLALVRLVDRLDRLGQAQQMGIFSSALIWDSNGEAILAAHRRTRPFVDALQEVNPEIFSDYTTMVDELLRTSAQLKIQAKRSGIEPAVAECASAAATSR